MKWVGGWEKDSEELENTIKSDNEKTIVKTMSNKNRLGTRKG